MNCLISSKEDHELDVFFGTYIVTPSVVHILLEFDVLVSFMKVIMVLMKDKYNSS